MNNNQHTILCVDDEKSILAALQRLLRKEKYRILTASSGEEGLNILKENNISLVITDQRMPQMSGTEFLARVKEKYPEVIRIILTGYTDVDSITESINQGHIYKFFLKPWNDHNLRLEIRQALEQYDLIQANKSLQETIFDQNEELTTINEELTTINENLENLVIERTKDLEIQNQALELSHTILEDLPLPIIGISAEGIIVLINKATQTIVCNNRCVEVGKRVQDYFSNDMAAKITGVLASNTPQVIKEYPLGGTSYDIDLIPLSGKFRDKGVLMSLRGIPGGDPGYAE
jgi:response regulator RpfG family c-di-GMP phosphodiesterase